MTESLKAGKVVTLDTVGLFADGAAVKTVGQETFRVSGCNLLLLCVRSTCEQHFYFH